MSGGGGSTTTNTIQKADPWGPAQPYLKGGLSDLAKWYSSDYGREYFPGSTVVPFSPFTEQALGMTAQRATQGSPLIDAAQQNLQQTLSGDFLNPESNPWLSGTFDLAAGKVRSALDSQFNSAGGYGGSLHQGAMASNLGDLATQLYGGAYDQERGRQMQAQSYAPGLASQDYLDTAQLANVGSAYEQQAGNYLTDAQNRYDFYQNQPYQRLLQFSQIANPIAGQGGTTNQSTTQPTNSNSTSEAIGTAISLASLAATIFSDPAVKTDIEPVDDDAVLARGLRVPAYKYRYKPELGPKFGGLKMGPMADDYAREYGGDGHTIPMPGMMGEMWAKQNALARKIKKLEAA